MPQELGFPYNYVGITPPSGANLLSADHFAALRRVSVDLTTGVLAKKVNNVANTLTFASPAAVATLNDITEDVETIRRSNQAGIISQTPAAAKAVAERRGRVRSRITLTCFYNYDAGRSYDVFLKDEKEPRLFVAERADDRILIGLVEVLNVDDTDQPDESGSATFTVELGNLAWSAAPTWR